MSKKESTEKPDQNSQDASIEERVRQMMDPSLPDTDATNSPIKEATDKSEPSTAPEVTDLPVPDKPLEIKILKNDEPKPDAEPTSAPELDAADVPEGVEPTPEPDPEPEPEPAPEASETSADAEDQATPDELPDDDPKTQDAVDDIVRHESDELIKSEDEKIADAFRPQGKKGFGQKLKAAIVDLWRNPRKRKALVGLSAVAILLIGVVPQSRYFVLNTAGVRASTSVRVLDESTLQPLRGVRVSAHGVEALTDEDGQARLDKVKLGRTDLTIEKRAFAPVSRKVTIGWGSNPQGEEKLKPTGTQYAFEVTDYLSDKGVVKAEATSGDASAFSDEQGKILLTMDEVPAEIEVAITREDYRTENLKIDADTKDTTRVKMAPARKHAYISRRDGRFDVYAAYADGKEEALVLEGTGNERDDMVLVPHPTDDVVALVSTREGKHNEDGYLLSTLTLIDLSTKKTKSVQSSERIQITGWLGERLVYVRVISGASASNPQRNRLMAYHYKDDTNNELASSNYFNDVMSVGDRVYYAPSGAYKKDDQVKLFSIKADGSDKKIIMDQEVWNLFRTSYDHIALSAPGAWYDYRVGDERPSALSGEPAELTSRTFTINPNGEKSLWVDVRDGKGTLLVHDTKTGEDKTLHTQSGLKTPVGWLNNNSVVYRIKTDTETADYAISLDGGGSKKIADVTNTGGIDRWYYY